MLTDFTDHEVLMHRNAHFDGEFAKMLGYYEQGGKGSQPDFEIDRIRELALIERDMGKDIAEIVLSDVEKEKILESQKIYKSLKSATKGLPKLISDLILSEEEHPQNAIDAIVKEKDKAVDALIKLLKTEHFHDPLFPVMPLPLNLLPNALASLVTRKRSSPFLNRLRKGTFLTMKPLSAPSQPSDYPPAISSSKWFTQSLTRSITTAPPWPSSPSKTTPSPLKFASTSLKTPTPTFSKMKPSPPISSLCAKGSKIPPKPKNSSLLPPPSPKTSNSMPT